MLTAGELADKVGSLETRIAALKLEAIRHVEGEDPFRDGRLGSSRNPE